MSPSISVLVGEIGDARPHVVLDNFRTLASYTWLYERVLRTLVTDALARSAQRGRARLEEIVEHSSYDETPMVARTVARPLHIGGGSPSSSLRVFGRTLFQTRSEWGAVSSWTPLGTDTPMYGLLFSHTVCAIPAKSAIE